MVDVRSTHPPPGIVERGGSTRWVRRNDVATGRAKRSAKRCRAALAGCDQRLPPAIRQPFGAAGLQMIVESTRAGVDGGALKPRSGDAVGSLLRISDESKRRLDESYQEFTLISYTLFGYEEIRPL